MLHGPTSHSVHSFVALTYWDLQTLGPQDTHACMHAATSSNVSPLHLLPRAKMQFKVSVLPNVSETSRHDTSCKTTTYYPRFKALTKLPHVNLICTLYALCMAWFVEYFMILQIYEASLGFSDKRTWQCWQTVLWGGEGWRRRCPFLWRIVRDAFKAIRAPRCNLVHLRVFPPCHVLSVLVTLGPKTRTFTWTLTWYELC